MVKIGRALKNYGLTKVQARRAEKERDAKRIANKTSQAENSEACGDKCTTQENGHKDSQQPCNDDPFLPVEVGQGERCRGREESDKPGNEEAPIVSDGCAFLKAPIAVYYPEHLERCIAEAQMIVSRFTQAQNKGKRQNPSNAARQKYADHLKASLKMLSDCRYAKLMMIIDGERRNKAKRSPSLFTIRRQAAVDQRWADNMAQSITVAVRRLVKDPWLSTKDTACLSKDYLPTPPLLLGVARPVGIRDWTAQKSTPDRKKIDAESHLCMRTTNRYLLDFSGVDKTEQTTQGEDLGESPRERLQRKIEQYGCGSEVVGDNSKSEELAIIVVNAAVAVQKKSRREAYDFMARSARRNAIRADLMTKLNVAQVLPVLLRYVRALLRSKQHDCAMYPSSEMVDVIVATMAQNQRRHVFLFVKSIATEFLGPDKDAFFARHEYYMFWSAVVKAAKMNLAQRWRAFANSFSCGPGELGRLSSDARRYGRITAEYLIPKFSSLVRCPRNQAKKKEVTDILQRYWLNMHVCIFKYGRTMTHLVSMQQIRLALNQTNPGEKPQMNQMFCLTGIQHLETELLTAVDNLFRRIRRRSAPDDNYCLAAVKDLLSKIVCRETRRVLIVARRMLSECIPDKATTSQASDSQKRPKKGNSKKT